MIEFYEVGLLIFFNQNKNSICGNVECISWPTILYTINYIIYILGIMESEMWSVDCEN